MTPAANAPRTIRRRRHRLHPAAISLITIAAAGFVIFYAFNGGLPFVHHFTLHAMVNNSVNVRAQSPVRIAGIDVGEVTGTSPAGRATEINFTIKDAGLPVHTDATMVIRDRLFLEGGYYLELNPGSPSAPTVHDGFTIPMSQTSTPVQFYQVLSTFNMASRSSLEHLLSTLNQGFSAQSGQPESGSGAGGLKLAIPQLTPVLKDTAWITRALRGTRPGDVETLLGSASQVTSALASSSTALTGLVHDLNVSAGALAATDGALGATISGIDRTLQSAPASLVRIDRALPPVTALALALDPSLKVAPPIVSRLTSVVHQLAQVVAPTEAGQLLRSLNTTFIEFPTVVRLLAGAFPVTKTATDCLRTHVVPILNAQVPDGALSTGRPVWQDFVHFLPNIAGASGNFDANGHYVRVLAGAGTNTLGSAGLLGSLPLLGQLVGSAPPGGGSLLGARPAWVGTLTPSVFRPDVACSTQRIPSLAAPSAAADLVARRTPGAKPLGSRGLSALISRMRAAVTPGGRP
ncbi:MAG: MlaD family protein [Solirubrobacteraceae bacterium]